MGVTSDNPIFIVITMKGRGYFFKIRYERENFQLSYAQLDYKRKTAKKFYNI